MVLDVADVGVVVGYGVGCAVDVEGGDGGWCVALAVGRQYRCHRLS